MFTTTVRHDNPTMRRAFVDQPLSPGTLRLDPDQAHHLTNVLRLQIGDAVELFNAANQSARGQITALEQGQAIVTIAEVIEQPPTRQITIASAIPKGDRADWMIEKLCEIGVTRFIPLLTDRSVVQPKGENKFDRWRRIATEAAKQSRRAGVMEIGPLTQLADCLNDGQAGIYLSTEPDVRPLVQLLMGGIDECGMMNDEAEQRSAERGTRNAEKDGENAERGTRSEEKDGESNSFSPRSAFRVPRFFIGPEGGWSDAELVDFRVRGLTPARLTATILRVETAAIAAAVIAAAL